MKDTRCFDLRCLTENIFYMRECVLKFLNPSSKEYIDATKIYEELWIERDELEHDIFDKK